MNEVTSSERAALADGVRRFAAAHSRRDDVRRELDSQIGYDVEAWRRIAGELGLVGLASPEGFGGAGYGLLEVGIAFEELGRALSAVPLLSTTRASQLVLALCDRSACAAYLPALADGSLIVTVAVAEANAQFDIDRTQTEARLDSRPSSGGGGGSMGRSSSCSTPSKPTFSSYPRDHPMGRPFRGDVLRA